MKIKTDSSIVIIEEQVSGYDLFFKLEAVTPLAASLLRDKLYENLSNRMKSVREEAYNIGWKDKASKKNKKKRNFFGNLTAHNGVGY